MTGFSIFKNGKINIMKMIKISNLCFDHYNPRLIEYGIEETVTDDEILKILFDETNITELIQSIISNGFFCNEAFLVVLEKNKYIVIDGNRRLAAIKILSDPIYSEMYGWKNHSDYKDVFQQIETVPCLLSTRNNSWNSIVYRHIKGFLKWNSYTKAGYIASLHRDYGISLESISFQLGDQYNFVQYLYRAFIILEKAEKSGVYFWKNRFYSQSYFSFLYICLNMDGICNFLGLTSEDKYKDKEFGELCEWIFGNKIKKIPPVIKSETDLKKLDCILDNSKSLLVFRTTRNLELSYNFCCSSNSVLEESLFDAKRNLVKVQYYLSTDFTDFSENSDWMEIAETIRKTIKDINNYMKIKLNNFEKQKR
jgi:hypothetical protein